MLLAKLLTSSSRIVTPNSPAALPHPIPPPQCFLSSLFHERHHPHGHTTTFLQLLYKPPHAQPLHRTILDQQEEIDIESETIN
ncbi:hypothetical protein HU200_021157 [Digitaria exilis]|uniref:Uncharacterized protein n=1 Tax=Digitaria exilis TaxID=1010633 RepID=A0A835EZX5_9POAL|nr:hypothetical protein HU200_021157 [Digitaria exilis]